MVSACYNKHMTMPKNPIKAEKYRKKLSEIAKGKIFSEEHKKKLSEAKIKYWEGMKRVRFSRTEMKNWIEVNGKTYSIENYNHALRIRRTLELERIAGRPKPEICEVCGKKGRICFDHCHNTGKFRGWICEQCNVILGYSRDDSKILRLLAEYLEK